MPKISAAQPMGPIQRTVVAYLFGDAGNLAAANGASEEAIRFVGAAGGLFAAIETAIPPEEVAEHERTLERLRAALGEA